MEKYFDGLFDVVSFSDHFSGPGIALQNFNTLNPRTVCSSQAKLDVYVYPKLTWMRFGERGTSDNSRRNM